MNIQLVSLQSHGDDRGSLISLEQGKNIPFSVKRVYYMFNTANKVIRGLHAHKKLKQIAIAITGSCKFLLDDGTEKVEVILSNPSQGLIIESFIWREMYDFSKDCVLLVLADSYYDENDYIRDYEEFILLSKQLNKTNSGY